MPIINSPQSLSFVFSMAPCIHYQAFSRIFDKSKYCCTEREIISSKQPAINVNYSNCCDFTYGVKHATVNKRWNEYHTTWICNTRPWSSFNKEGTVFVLLLPEEPAAEPLAWPVEEEFGFLDLLILATVFTPPKIKTDAPLVSQTDEVGRHRQLSEQASSYFRTYGVILSARGADRLLCAVINRRKPAEERMDYLYLFTAGFLFFPSSHILFTYLQKFIFPSLNFVDRFAISTR